MDLHILDLTSWIKLRCFFQIAFTLVQLSSFHIGYTSSVQRLSVIFIIQQNLA